MTRSTRPPNAWRADVPESAPRAESLAVMSSATADSLGYPWDRKPDPPRSPISAPRLGRAATEGLLKGWAGLEKSNIFKAVSPEVQQVALAAVNKG